MTRPMMGFGPPKPGRDQSTGVRISPGLPHPKFEHVKLSTSPQRVISAILQDFYALSVWSVSSLRIRVTRAASTSLGNSTSCKRNVRCSSVWRYGATLLVLTACCAMMFSPAVSSAIFSPQHYTAVQPVVLFECRQGQVVVS